MASTNVAKATVAEGAPVIFKPGEALDAAKRINSSDKLLQVLFTICSFK
jgi:hypothetical protein